MPQFFLSWASSDDDGYSLRFYRDLSARIAALTGINEDIGFVEPGQRGEPDPGAPWPPAAWNAVNSCQAFVALCSPRYFLDDRAGREWWIFGERLRRYQERTGQHAPALVPVLWSGATPRSGIRADEDEEAVGYLIRLRHLRRRYEEKVEAYAEQIAVAIRGPRIPPLVPELEPNAIPNAFDPTRSSGMSDQLPNPKTLASQPAQHVHFVVAAGNRAEMAGVRHNLEFYGDRGRDWSPFLPELPGPLATHARRVAAHRLFNSEVAELDDLAGRLEHARRNNEIVILLVDSWITKLAQYRQTLEAFDQQDEPEVAVLAPVSGADTETTRHRGELRSNLRNVIHRSLAQRDHMVRIEIDDSASFETDLVAVLEEAQNRIFRYGKVFRRPAEAAPDSLPILQGP